MLFNNTKNMVMGGTCGSIDTDNGHKPPCHYLVMWEREQGSVWNAHRPAVVMGPVEQGRDVENKRGGETAPPARPRPLVATICMMHLL